jgi:hypothetical protein
MTSTVQRMTLFVLLLYSADPVPTGMAKILDGARLPQPGQESNQITQA